MCRNFNFGKSITSVSDRNYIRTLKSITQESIPFKFSFILGELTSNVNEYKCERESKCIPKRHVCDKWKHCSDGSDEKQCMS